MCNVCDGDGCMLCDYSYEDAEWRSICEEIEEEYERDDTEYGE
jgi:hypothetical protein